MTEHSIEQLVEEITNKVKQRLDSPGSVAKANRGDTGCISGPPCIEPLPDSRGYSFFAGKRISQNDRRSEVSAQASTYRPSELASFIDHTLLKAQASVEELTKICKEATTYNFATVCVNAANIPVVAKLLAGSKVKPIAVVGFPLGASTSSAKSFEAREAISAGAREIDMVINIGALKSKDYKLVYDDIVAVVEVSKPYPVKVILETSYLDHDEKVAACVMAKTAGATFVKTSTGFSGAGATVEDIQLMRRTVGPEMGVKASGGIRSREDLEAMIAAGATRIGASSSVAIVEGTTSSSSY